MSDDVSEEAGPLEQITDLFKDGLKSRFNDPIVSTLIIAFLISNWDLLFVAFGGTDTPHKRIDEIESAFLFQEKSGFALGASFHRLLLPLGATAFYLFVWPWIMKKPLQKIEDYRVQKKNREMKALEARTDIRDKLEQLALALKVSRSANEDRLKRIGALENEIAKLKSENQTLKDEAAKNDDLKKQVEEANAAMTEFRKVYPDPTDGGEEVWDFDLPIIGYAKKKRISGDDALAHYIRALKAQFKALRAKYKSSQSLRVAESLIESAAEMDFSAGIRFDSSMAEFKGSAALLDEDKKNLQRVLSLFDAIKKYRT